MRAPVFATALLAACAGHRVPDTFPPEAARYLGAPGELRVCTSQVPSAGPLKGAERSAWEQAVGAMAGGDSGAAAAALDGAGEHPALGSARATLGWLQGARVDALSQLQSLSAEWPGDPCLHQAAASALLQLGGGFVELSMARGHVRDAAKLAPEDPEILFLSASIQVLDEDPSGAASTLRRALQSDPEHLASAGLLGSLYLNQGDAMLAIPLLERVRAGGGDVGDALAAAYYGAGQIDAYLREASRLGRPLGDGGALADAADPVAAFRELLGLGEGQERLFATIETSLGAMRCELFWDLTPVAVGNFVGLAIGTLGWTHPDTDEAMEGPLYAGTTFHRVIPQFMIQGGDPVGTGHGDPGYEYPDEIHPSLFFSQPGALAMANSGPDTNGSQFFITEVPVAHLNGGYTIFGQCDQAAVDAVYKIARVPTGQMDKPTEDVTIEAIRIAAGD